MLHCVAVCCSVLQCGAVCCSVLQCVAVCCSMLLFIREKESNSDFGMVNLWFSWLLRMSTGCFVCGSVLQRVAAWCSVMQRVAEFGSQLILENVYWGRVCCSVLQRVAVC